MENHFRISTGQTYQVHGYYIFNGNIHRLTQDYENNQMICYFDLEIERFTRFSLPPRVYHDKEDGLREYRLYVFDGKLCLYDIVNSNYMVHWTMNVYGDGNSWVEGSTWRKPVRLEDLHLDLKVRSKSFSAMNMSETLLIYSESTRTAKAYDNLQRSTYSKFLFSQSYGGSQHSIIKI